MVLDFSYFGGLIHFQLTYLETALFLILGAVISHFIGYIILTSKFAGVYEHFTFFNISDYFLPPFLDASSLRKDWKGYVLYLVLLFFTPIYCIISVISLLVHLIKHRNDEEEE